MTQEFNNLVSAIKSQLKVDNPKMSNEELDKQSLAIAKLKQPISESSDKLDEEGRYIVAENVEFRLSGGINSIEE